MAVYFERGKWVADGKTRGDVRRLGTASWGVNRQKAFSTEWLWFFKNDENEWQELENSHAIEEAHADGRADFEFARGRRAQFKYKIDFHRKNPASVKRSIYVYSKYLRTIYTCVYNHVQVHVCLCSEQAGKPFNSKTARLASQTQVSSLHLRSYVTCTRTFCILKNV